MMTGPEFFRTGMGKKFYEGDVPRIVNALEQIAHELKRFNDMKENQKENNVNSKG